MLIHIFFVDIFVTFFHLKGSLRSKYDLNRDSIFCFDFIEKNMKINLDKVVVF